MVSKVNLNGAIKPWHAHDGEQVMSRLNYRFYQQGLELSGHLTCASLEYLFKNQGGKGLTLLRDQSARQWAKVADLTSFLISATSPHDSNQDRRFVLDLSGLVEIDTVGLAALKRLILHLKNSDLALKCEIQGATALLIKLIELYNQQAFFLPMFEVSPLLPL